MTRALTLGMIALLFIPVVMTLSTPAATCCCGARTCPMRVGCKAGSCSIGTILSSLIPMQPPAIIAAAYELAAPEAMIVGVSPASIWSGIGLAPPDPPPPQRG